MTDDTTQPAPNISTEHQRDGDAARPGDTLDRNPARTEGGNVQEEVEDRPNVCTVMPEDYSKDQRQQPE